MTDVVMPQAIVMRQVDDLLPYARNSRTHSPEQVAKLAASIKEFGWTVPILVDGEGTIVAGHGRILAARKLKLSEVPTIDVGHLSDAQRRAYVIADNRLALDAGWDEEMLRIEFADLTEAGFDLALTGFTEEEISSFVDAIEHLDPQADPDDIPDVSVTCVSKPGDLWLLGRHRVMCGDSRILADFETLMDGKVADMVLTDPPYNVDYSGGTKSKMKIENDNMGDADFLQFLSDVFSNAILSCKDGGAVYVFHADSEGLNFRRALKETGWLFKQCLVWVKNSLVLGRQDYQWQHEPILYGWKPGASHRWFSDRKQTTVINFQRPSKSEEHPTMKPVGLISYLLGNSSEKKDLILDPFLGSGSTLIACEEQGRCCYGLEIDPRFADVIVRRWQKYTGKDAILASSGLTFNQEAEA